MFIIGFVMHGLACCYVYIGLMHINLDYEYYDNWINRFHLQDTSPLEIYSTALIFTTDTVTTIGYGDIYSLTNIEKVYTCFLIYIGMIVFAMIRQRIKLWNSPETHKDKHTDIENETLNFFFELKKTQPKDKDEDKVQTPRPEIVKT